MAGRVKYRKQIQSIVRDFEENRSLGKLNTQKPRKNHTNLI
jgi:hypothetical protein